MVTDYKANRAAMPGDLAEQIPWVHEACEALGVPVINAEGFEADDVIATLARCAVQEGYDVAIVTGDKDFFQLVDDRIRVFNPRDEGTWYDAEGVREKWGVGPEHVVDVLALMGDAVDNIKGVPGIGEKGAKDLIATWGSLDALLAHAAEVPQKKYREALLAHADDARQSRELLRFRTDVPVRLRGRRVPVPRRVARAVLRAVLAARVPLADDGVRADGRHDREAVRGRDDDGRAHGARGGAARRRPVCPARAARPADRHGRRRSWAWHSPRPPVAPGTCRCSRDRCLASRDSPPSEVLAALEAGARGSFRRKGRPRHQVRRRSCWRSTALRWRAWCSIRWWSATCSMRRVPATRSKTPPSSISATRR